MKYLTFITLLISGLSFAQWPQGKGKFYTKASVWNQTSTTHFEPDGSISQQGGERTYFIPGLYARYGLDDKWTITGFLPYISTSQEIQFTHGFGFRTGNAIGDATLAVEHHIKKFKNGSLIAVDYTLGIPLGKQDPIVGTGDGEWNQMVRLLFGGGYPIGKQNFYLKSHVGYNARTMGFVDEFRAGLETGTTIRDTSVLLRLNNITALGDVTSPATTIFGNGIEQTTLGFEATYHLFDYLGISLGYSHFLAGRFVFNAPSWTYGIVFKN